MLIRLVEVDGDIHITCIAVSLTETKDGICFGTEGCGIINYLVVYVLSLEIRLVHCLHFSGKLI